MSSRGLSHSQAGRCALRKEWMWRTARGIRSLSSGLNGWARALSARFKRLQMNGPPMQNPITIGGLAGRGVAQVRRDAAILALELLDRGEGRDAARTIT